METCADVEMENGVWAATYVVVETDYVAVERENGVDAVMGFAVVVVTDFHDDVLQTATFLSLLMTCRDLCPLVTWIDHDPSLSESVTDHDLCPVVTWICHDPFYGVRVIWICHGSSQLTSSWLAGPWGVMAAAIYCVTI